jgi:membrane-associated phospholipid phosphatase
MSVSPVVSSASDAAPLLARRSRALPWLILWALLIMSQVALLANHAALDTLSWRATRWFIGDQDAYRWNDYKAWYPIKHPGEPVPFYARINPPWTRVLAGGRLEARIYKRTEFLWRVLRDLGEPATTALVIALVVLYDRRRWKAGLIVLAGTASAGLLGWLIRALAGRYRPDSELNGQNLDGLSVWLPFRGFSETSNLSWPSGHATLAFATAAVLVYLSPKGKWVFLAFAAGCALARVVMQAHFYADVLFGSVLGWTASWFIAQAIDRLIPDPDPAAASPG